MQAYILVFLALFATVAAEDDCLGNQAITFINLAINIQDSIKCPCNGSSTDAEAGTCKCFEIPKNNNCNLTCFEDGIAKYKGRPDLRPVLQLFVMKFHHKARRCSRLYPSCMEPCGEMKIVNATKFWTTLKEAYQQIKFSK